MSLPNGTEKLLSRLDKVERLTNGKHQGRWRACCPAHQDKDPSLSVTLTDNGTTLIKCWAGCSAHDVVGAVGMNLSELFPESRTEHRIKPNHRPFSGEQAARVLAADALVVMMAAAKVRMAEELTEEDMTAMGDISARCSAIARGV